jgi:hypothetical protein
MPIAPPAERGALPQIPRAEWEAHKNFRTQTLLLGSHANFREVSAFLIKQSEENLKNDPGGAPSLSLLHLFERWKRAMKSHERYEERKLYPFLVERFGLKPEELEQEHATLGKADARVRHAFEQPNDFWESNDERNAGAVEALRALMHHDQILRDHLEHEEDLVIPCLLTLSADEFARFSWG